jgi:hypothetical protein
MRSDHRGRQQEPDIMTAAEAHDKETLEGAEREALVAQCVDVVIATFVKAGYRLPSVAAIQIAEYRIKKAIADSLAPARKG